jgi:hypothetical protein
MASPQSPELDVLDVLTRVGAARDVASAHLGEQLDEVDALLVSDVLRTAGRVGETIELRRALVSLCALVRAIDAALQDRITLEELRAGLALHAARTDRFARFADARVLLRTLEELLGRDTPTSGLVALRGQVGILHRDLHTFLVEQLTGSIDGALPSATVPTRPPDPRAGHEVVDPLGARAAHDLVDELLHGARDHPVTGLLGAAWIRGWSAVPILGEQVGEDPAELDRLAAAFTLLEPVPTTLVQVDVRRQPRWRLDGRALVLGEGLRRSWRLPATRSGLALASIERRGWSVVASDPDDLSFAIVEGAGHHALLGPPPFVAAACGVDSPIQAVARFREQVEQLAELDGTDEPPADLLEVAERFGRLRRRSR